MALLSRLVIREVSRAWLQAHWLPRPRPFLPQSWVSGTLFLLGFHPAAHTGGLSSAYRSVCEALCLSGSCRSQSSEFLQHPVCAPDLGVPVSPSGESLCLTAGALGEGAWAASSPVLSWPQRFQAVPWASGSGAAAGLGRRGSRLPCRPRPSLRGLLGAFPEETTGRGAPSASRPQAGPGREPLGLSSFGVVTQGPKESGWCSFSLRGCSSLVP